MDIKAFQNKWLGFIKKYRFVALVLAIGLVLMLLPGKTSVSDTPIPVSENEKQQHTDPSEKLSKILSRVEGAGNVEVLLTVASGEETVFQTNDDISVSEGNSATHKTTVTVTDNNRKQDGLVRQINPPRYLGAIVVCEGAENPTVRLAIVEAVARVTGLGSDRVCVLKMK